MRSRSDQLHAHQYATQRIVSALVTHDPDPRHSAFGRTGTTALAGALVALIALGAVFAYSAITGRAGATELRDETVVLMEKETGAQYVYTRADDRLHPVLNHTSGLLVTSMPGARSVTVRRSVLARLQGEAGLSLGATLGIADAPPTPPSASELVRDPWYLCTTSTGSPVRPHSELRIGGPGDTTGRALTGTEPGSDPEALLVAEESGRQYLVYANHKFLLRNQSTVLTAFSWRGRVPVPVAAAWLNALPAGPDLAPLHIDGLRDRSSVLGQPVGRLYRAPGQGDTFQWAVVLRDAVLPITEVQAQLLNSDPATVVGAPITLGAAEFSTLPTTAADPSNAGQELLPATVPRLVTAGTTCLTVTDAAAGVTEVRVHPETLVPPAGAGPADSGQPRGTGATGAATADQVVVPFGRGVLVEPASSPDAPAGTSALTIVTDTGRRYPIADEDALARLGYTPAMARRMPSELVALIPEGPALGVAAARTPR